MKNNILSFFTIAIFAIAFSSCKKDLVKNPNLTEYNTDLEQFNAVWNGLNTTYALWSIDPTDWDKVYETYHLIFEEMENKSDAEWKAAWKELTSTLIDHHLVIHLERPSTSVKISLSPGYDELQSREYFHYALSLADHKAALLKLELEERLKESQYDIFSDTLLCSGILDGDIAYFYASTLHTTLESKKSFKHFKQLVANEKIKSAIVDLRDNKGGFSYNVNSLVSCFTPKPIRIGYNQSKTGLGRYDLGPKVPQVAETGTFNGITIEGQDKDIPVIALGNVLTCSAAELSMLAIKYLPQGYMVGERTWGATCALIDFFDVFYSGSFGDSQMNGNNWIGHGHYVYTPKYLFSGIDGTIYEGIGITPDKECFFDQSDWNNGIDNQLECAVEFAKEKMNQ